MTVRPAWDPGRYLRRAGHRPRPFPDLLARVDPGPGGPVRHGLSVPARLRRRPEGGRHPVLRCGFSFRLRLIEARVNLVIPPQ